VTDKIKFGQVRRFKPKEFLSRIHPSFADQEFIVGEPVIGETGRVWIQVIGMTNTITGHRYRSWYDDIRLESVLIPHVSASGATEEKL